MNIQEVLEDPVSQELLQSRPVTHLAYVGTDGCPRVVPIGYLWTGSEFELFTAPSAPKVGALKARPTVALTFDNENQPPHILLVHGTSSVELEEGVPAAYLEASRRYVPEDQWEGFEQRVRALYTEMVRITVTPTWAKVLDFETRLPSAIEQLIRRSQD